MVLSIAILNLRVSGVSDPSSGLLKSAMLNFRYIVSVVMPVILSIFLFFGSVHYFGDILNSNINWWVFNTQLDAAWFFYMVSGMASIKSTYSLWVHEYIPTTDLTNIVEAWFVISFTLGAFLVLLSGSVFLLYWALLAINFPFTSTISSVPYLWSILILLVVVITEIDPDSD